IVEPPQYGNLTVNSVPEGASIWLDGEDTSEVTNTTLTEVEVGKHNVTLKLEGYKDSTKQVTIEANETAILDFVLAEIVEPPQYGNLTVNSVPEGASIWLDGEDTSEVTNTTLTEVEVGEHSVTLTLDDYHNATKPITVVAGETVSLHFDLEKVAVVPVANFTANVTEGVAPLTVQFTDKSLNATTWHWDFGDNRTAIAKNPIITYRKPGNYTVTLNASNAHYYDVETKAEYITVKLPNPVASFAVDKASGDAPLTVQFTDTSNWKPDTYEWNFGDGTTSTEQNPVHTYTTAGTYTVTLKVSRDGGSTSTATKNVAVKPVADFEADTTRGDSPLTVKFTDLSEGAVDEWKWDFGDGRTSTEQDPVHVYNTTGTYTVTLTAKKGALTSTETKEAFITAVNPDASLDAEFRANTTQGYAPLAVKFFDQSQGEVTKWQWNFGDGTTSTEQNPVHTYSKAGNHTVTLKVTGPRGSDTTTKSAYITARDPKPVAVFSADKVRGETPLIVQFTDKSAGAPPLTYTWDFGDGVTSSFQNPTHVFDYDGDGARTYTVKLTVKNGKGVSSIETKIIVVSPPQMESVSDRINADTAKAKEDVPLTYREFELKILKNTSAKKNGEAIDVLSVQVAPELAEPPAGTIKIGEKAFKLGPEGAKFDPPIPITITFTKDEWEQMFGDGRTTKLQRYDGQKWSELTDQVEDPVNYTITGYTSSFGVFAPITTEPTTEPEPTHTPYTPSGGGGSGPTYTSYTGTGTLTVGSSNIALRSIKVNAEDKAGSLFVQIGTKVLDKDGNPLTSITLTPLASDDMPAVPSGALFKFAGYVYEAGPDGATFEPGITLAFDLPADAWNALDPDNNDFKVKWYNEETEEWEDVPTTTYKSTRSVDAEITHFSIFALFTEPVTTPTETPTPPVDIDIPTTPPVDEKPPAGEFPTTIFAIVVVLVIVIAAGYFFIVRK
ncbi:MAG: PKD domain-containing protein, partial [Methanoculleus sp.]